MRTVVHLSDLHFGKVEHALLTPLAEAVIALATGAYIAVR